VHLVDQRAIVDQREEEGSAFHRLDVARAFVLPQLSLEDGHRLLCYDCHILSCSTYVASGVSEVRARTILRDLRDRNELATSLATFSGPSTSSPVGPGLSMRLCLLCRLAALLHDCS
jgi:hypothetical protein